MMERVRSYNKRPFLISLTVLAALGCAVYAHFRFWQARDLLGQIVWVRDPRTEGVEDARPFDQASGTAYLLLEEDYSRAGYAGPPKDDVTKRRDYFLNRFRFLPDCWRLTKKEPVGVEPEYLLAAPLDSVGRFRFEDLPAGRHTLFIRWGNSPDPSNCISGPYEVLPSDRESGEKRFLVSNFDTIDT